MLSENHPNTLITASNIARDLRDAGEYERSVDQLRAALRIYVDVWGAASRGALNAQANLGVSLRSAGRADEALQRLNAPAERRRGQCQLLGGGLYGTQARDLDECLDGGERW